jgi:2-phospho-L-lactate guanylyltransferase
MTERWASVARFAERVRGVRAEEFRLVTGDLAVINTDLNSHNFIVGAETVWLIDWEKARIGPTVLDLAHFLLPTTTLWRDASATRLRPEAEEHFVSTYLGQRPELHGGQYRRALRSMKRLAALRAVAWCAWALAASERNIRAIANDETLAKCRLFTSRNFLDALIDDLWA